MSASEKRHAIMQAHCIVAVDSYFDARPLIDTTDNRRLVEAGFERGFEAAPKDDSNPELVDFVEQLTEWHENTVEHLREVSDQVKDKTSVQAGVDGPAIDLNEREALIFRLGMEASLAALGKLPFTVTSPATHGANDD